MIKVMLVLSVMVANALAFEPMEQDTCQTSQVTIEELSNGLGPMTIPAGRITEFSLRYQSINCINESYAVSGAWRVYSPDGATWSGLDLVELALYKIEILPDVFEDFMFGDIFYQAWTRQVGTNTHGFAGVMTTLSEGLYDGFNYPALQLSLIPDIGSGGKTICIEIAHEYNGYDWEWSAFSGNLIVPDWDGPYCYTVAPCCGSFTNGFTGNVNCSVDGNRNLSDITRMIDYVYISKAPLCCPENGNTDGDDAGNTNLADITRLIDHVYISKAETAPCE